MQDIIAPPLMGYLRSWHLTSTTRLRAAGNTVELSFQDFIDLFEPRHIRSLTRAIEANRLRYMQDKANPFALVMSWRSYAACSAAVFTKETAIICSRTKSSRINLPRSGDKLRPGHVANIAKALTGKAKTEDHRKAISQATTGVPKASWGEERKAARSAQRMAQEAAKLAVNGAA